MISPKVTAWLKNPQLSDLDLFTLCFSPRGCLAGLATMDLTFEEQWTVADKLLKRYGNIWT